MGNPAYDARRLAEQAEAERDKAFADATKLALEGIMNFFNGRATLAITPMVVPGTTGLPVGYGIRFIRDAH
jgi:hypothetical protein